MKKYSKKGRHGTHSPFVYEFVSKVLRGPSNRKSFLGKYFFPVTYIKDPSRIYLNFLTFYVAHATFFVSDVTEEKKLEIPKGVSRVLFIQKEGMVWTNEFMTSLIELQNQGVEYAIWVEKIKTAIPEQYFNRVIELEQHKIYFQHASFKEREYFRLW